jgi:hypothetical protein
MLEFLSPSPLDRQQAYIDLMSHLYRFEGLPFYAVHCGCLESSRPVPVAAHNAGRTTTTTTRTWPRDESL